MSIEVIALEHFSAPTQTETETTPQARKYNAVFHSFLSDDSKHDASWNYCTQKRIIELLNQQKNISNMLSTIWENTDGCAENCRYATELYLVSMLSQALYVIIDRGISAT